MTSLYVDRRGVRLELDASAIVFYENDERVGTVPINPLSRVFIRGDVQLSASLLGKLGEHGVGVVVLSGRQGKPTLLMARPHNDAQRRVEQIRRSLDSYFCLRFAQELIAEKIDTQISWFDEMRQKDMYVRYELTHAIKLLKASRLAVTSVSSLAMLRGVEGSAARAYFDGLKAVVPASLKFFSRNRRPPRDPFNALLSLTYTMVHAETSIALFGAGLDPYVGFYHQLDFGRESLSSDLMEPLRPLADEFCQRLVRRRVMTEEHFSTTDAGCFLGKAGRKHYYEAYEKHSESLRAAVQKQVEKSLALITDASSDGFSGDEEGGERCG